MCDDCRQRLDEDNMRVHIARGVEFNSMSMNEHIHNGAFTYATMHRGHALGSERNLWASPRVFIMVVPGAIGQRCHDLVVSKLWLLSLPISLIDRQ